MKKEIDIELLWPNFRHFELYYMRCSCSDFSQWNIVLKRIITEILFPICKALEIETSGNETEFFPRADEWEFQVMHAIAHDAITSLSSF